jgi:hypothetical protein
MYIFLRNLILSASQKWNNINTVTPPSNPLPAFKDHSAIFDAIKNQVYVFGGKLKGNATNDLWVLDLSNKIQQI